MVGVQEADVSSGVVSNSSLLFYLQTGDTYMVTYDFDPDCPSECRCGDDGYIGCVGCSVPATRAPTAPPTSKV